ncbi:2Fe-2S iron-sulfur cluster binding domain-containing protein [Patescibacteria group bacterium]|nr:2Fe-2S iron-sulfur cluster binding domain-containing protein [Patescibacteria group bacterium]
MKYTLIHEKAGRSVEVEVGAGESVALSALNGARVHMFGPCAGMGVCLRCYRKIVAGAENLQKKPDAASDFLLKNGHEVQTCQVTVIGEGVQIESGL